MFPQTRLGWSAWFALVPAMLLIRAAPGTREAIVRGWCFGSGFLLTALYWLAPSIGPGLPLVAAVFGGLWTGWALAVRAVLPPARAGEGAGSGRAPGSAGRRRPVPAVLGTVIVVPAAWITGELVRSWDALGGPWALLGSSQWRHPAELGLAPLGGVWLVGWAIVAANAAVALAITVPRHRERAAGVLAAAALVAAGPVAYALRGDPGAGGAVPVSFPDSDSSRLRVALVQPGVVRGAAERFAAQERLTAALPPRTYRLVVWGESSVGFDLDRRPDLLRRLTAQAARLSADLLVNVDARDARGRISKTAMLVGPGGIEGRYAKMRLVPFGEYIPLRSLLGWLGRISKAAGEDRVTGRSIRIMRPDGLPVGPLICFESAFPDLARAEVRRGAALIVYQTATSTYQDTWAPEQHAGLAALRAAETGRPVVQAALTGVSAAYDPRGRLLGWMGTGRRGVLEAAPPAATPAHETPYVRFGDYVPFTGLIVFTLAATAAALDRRRARGTPARRTI